MSTLLETLVGTPLWAALEEELQRAREPRVRRLVSGQCSHEEYLTVSGEVRGIDIVLSMSKGDKS